MFEMSKVDRRWWVLATIGVGTFMSALDASVVNVLLPVLRRDLHTTVAGIEWVTVVYLLVVSGLLLGFGRAGDLFGHKRIYVAGFALFIGGSAMCGFASSAGILIAVRGLQAVGGAMLFANAPAILTKTFPATERGRALGALGTFTYLGLTAGPSLGGWLATAFGWRSVFFINVPIGLLGMWLAIRVIEDDRPEKRRERFDVLGASVFTLGLVALLGALNQGHAWGWGAVRTLALAGGATVLLVVFTMIERRRHAPMLDLGLFRSRVFAATTINALLNYICLYSVVFVIPFLLIQGRGLNARDAGIIMTAQPIIMAIVAPLSGTLSDRIGSRGPASFGMLSMAAGLLLLAALSAHGSLIAIAASLAVVGLGTGAFISPNNSALMGSAPWARQGIAAGVLATARNVGMVLGVGLSGAVLTTALAVGGSASKGQDLVHGVVMSLIVAAGLAIIGSGVALIRE